MAVASALQQAMRCRMKTGCFIVLYATKSSNIDVSRQNSKDTAGAEQNPQITYKGQVWSDGSDGHHVSDNDSSTSSNNALIVQLQKDTNASLLAREHTESCLDHMYL
jgi:hypothetical protein